MSEHPVLALRAILTADFTHDLPPGVHAVEPWCAEPQFFPGASGMPTEHSWPDVQPGSRGIPDRLPSVDQRDVMVLGNFQATVTSYRRIVDGAIGGFPVTWRALRHLLAAIEPSRTFLTNVHPGLPDADRDTAPFPTTPSYLARCRRLLTAEIRLLQPRLVVSLGTPAARMLAAVTPALEQWLPWPGFAALRGAGRQVVADCEVGGVAFTATAVHHPSAVVSRAVRDLEAGLIENAHPNRRT